MEHTENGGTASTAIFSFIRLNPLDPRDPRRVLVLVCGLRASKQAYNLV
jgi:hypothetical protein